LESKVQGQSVKVDTQEIRLVEAERKIESILLQGTSSDAADDNEILSSSRKRLKRSPQSLYRNVTRKLNVKIKNEILEKQANAAANPHSIKVQYRSCHEIFMAHLGRVSSSLTYNRDVFTTYIDPDGLGIGDPPILVECDMTNGKYIIFKY